MLWRKGFFRVWVVLSACWIITIAAFSYSGISDPAIDKRAFVYSDIDIEESQRITPIPTEILHSKRIYYVSYESDAHKMLLTQKIEKKAVEIEVGGIPEFSLFLPAGLDDTAMAAIAKTAIKPMVEIRTQMVSKRRRERLLEGVTMALLPPAIFLIFGIAIAWVFAGFRRSA